MATRPSAYPEWATGGSADVTTPPSQKRSLGWLSGEPAVAAFFNWLGKTTYEWIVYFDSTSRVFDTLDDGVSTAAVGDTFLVNEYDLDSLPGTSLGTIAAGASVVDVAVDGRYVYIATATTLKRYARTTGTLATTYTKTNAGNIVRVVTNGDVVVIAYSTYVECFEAAGASRWVVNHSATVNDVAVDATRAYYVGAHSSNVQLKALSLASAGATVWSYGHGGAGGIETLYSVATDGRCVYIAGDAAGSGGGTATSGANLRALNAANGGDATGEGSGTAADTAGLSWDAVAATDVISRGCIAVDDQRVFVGYQSAVTVEARSKLTGAVLSTVTPPSSVVVQRLSVDQDWLIVGSSATGNVALGLSKADLSTAWRFDSTGGAWVASDGAAVFASTSSTLHRVARGNRAGRWLRVDPDDVGLPYRWLAIPER